MLKLLFITNNPPLASFAAASGVDRIFVDLEIMGKPERQGHLDTLISRHTIADVPAVRQAVPAHELLVRLNPLHAGSGAEIDAAVAAGADLLMLPMYRTTDDVARFLELVAGRAGVIPLLETPDAVDGAGEVAALPGVREVFIGLNDLHLGLGMAFMFEPLANGLVDQMAAQIRAAGKPFGFGGIARMGEGLLPGEWILGEHQRLGSSSVILSRTFHRCAADVDALAAQMDFGAEIAKLRACELDLARRTPEEVLRDQRITQEKIRVIAADRRVRA